MKHHHKKMPVGGTETNLFVDEQTALRDGIAITLALVLIGIAAIVIAKYLAIDSQITFAVFASSAAHPITFVLRRLFNYFV